VIAIAGAFPQPINLYSFVEGTLGQQAVIVVDDEVKLN